MKVHVKGQPNAVELGKNQFIGSGGEGQIYAKGGTAYKIYNDPSKMIPEGKIQELSVISEPNIIRPLDVILDEKTNNPVGYTMRYLTGTVPLCQLFNKIFKQKNSISPKQIVELVQKIQKGVIHIHSHKGILIVDCNEMNFLVNNQFNEAFFIDTDSYQTPSFRATAIMESIRDRHVSNNHFTQESDWFAWGIITFQLFIGIHPYKGKHPTVNGMDARMMQNISVFNPQVGIPAVCEPFDVIPQTYRDWYKAVFEDGKRLPPPLGLVASVTLVSKIDKIVGSDKFEIKEMADLSDLGNIIGVQYHFGTRVVQQERGIMIDETADKTVPADAKIGFTPHLNHVIAATVNKGSMTLYNASNGKQVTQQPRSGSVMSYNGNLYVKDGDSVYLITYVEQPLQTRASIQLVATVLDKATKIYDGVLIQNLLEATYVSIFPTAKEHFQIRLKELEKHRVVDAKFEKGILMVVGVRPDGKYDRFVFRFSKTFDSYDSWSEKDITYAGLNFVVLDTGNCVHIDEEERVNIFRSVKDDKKMVQIKDPALAGFRLHKYCAEVIGSKGQKIFKIKMK